MNLNAAPVIHARIKNNDFPSSLLVAPSDFDNNDVLWAREHITNSTRFFEMVPDEGRRVVFSNSKVLITGISINIAELNKLCGKESEYANVDRNRTNYAFIGFAIPKSEISSVFDVPYSLFLEQYEKWMKKLWDTEFQPNGMFCTKADYTQINLPNVADVCDNIKMNNNGKPVIIDSGIAPVEYIAAKATELAINNNEFAFCSNVNMKKIIAESRFNMVTSSKAASIAAEIPGSTLTTEKYVTSKPELIEKPPEIRTESNYENPPQIKKLPVTPSDVSYPPVYQVKTKDEDNHTDCHTGISGNKNNKMFFLIAAAVLILVIVLIAMLGFNE